MPVVPPFTIAPLTIAIPLLLNVAKLPVPPRAFMVKIPVPVTCTVALSALIPENPKLLGVACVFANKDKSPFTVDTFDNGEKLI